MLVQYVIQDEIPVSIGGNLPLPSSFSSCLFLPLWSFLGLWPVRRTVGAAVEASG